MTATVLSWIGAVTVLIAFTLNVRKVVSQTSLLYLFLNIAGSLLLGASAFMTKSYPFFILNLVWVLVAIYTLITLQTKEQEAK
jgi:Na+/H+-translocating membrane pyrophosphatase